MNMSGSGFQVMTMLMTPILKVASILQAVPAHLRAHLQLWISDTATYELKNKVMELEALATRWDSSNSLSLPPEWAWMRQRRWTWTTSEETWEEQVEGQRKVQRTGERKEQVRRQRLVEEW